MTAHAAMLEALREAQKHVTDERILSVIRAAIRAGEEAPKEYRAVMRSDGSVVRVKDGDTPQGWVKAFPHVYMLESRIAAGEWEREGKC
jgi:hypothetical protein